ncbi:MAG: extracellular solute-binding protein [Clostridia bacterium]|nr:extracellular solute-binding protein [Clostridia bacterium]
MKKLLCLVLVLAMMATLAVSFGEEEKTYDLQGMTVKVRLWDFPNPYSEDTDKVNIDKYLPIFEAAKAKYNCDFAFYSPTVEYDEFTTEWLQSIASGSPAWHITNNFSGMWIITMAANDGLVDISKALDTIKIPEGLKHIATSGDAVYGFTTGYPGTEGLVYNKAMIEEAGMEYTPTEMFLNGTWSYDDFYNYLVELQSKLPEGDYAFFIDPNYWSIFASTANGTMPISDTLELTMTSDAYIETMEFLQKLFNAGVCRMPNVTENGSYDNWGTPSATFDQGVEVAMTHRAGWQFGGLNNNGIDWGFAPYPWGSNVTIENNDYHTLSDNYRAAFYDYGCMGTILSGVENDFPGIDKDYLTEALVNLTYDLFVSEESQASLAAKADGAEEEGEINMGAFNYEEDAIIFNWLSERVIFNNYVSFGNADMLDCTYNDHEKINWFGNAIRYAVYDNLSMRAVLEAIAPQIEADLVDAGVK